MNIRLLFLALILALVPINACADSITILAAGDVTLTHRISSSEDLSFFSPEAEQYIAAADAFFWNCEMSGQSSVYKQNNFIFLSDGRDLHKFAFGNGAASTANNHVFDGYQESALDLMDKLSYANIRHNGLHFKGNYSPLELFLSDGTKLIFIAGSQMSIIGSGPDVVALNYAQILKEIAEARLKLSEAIVVVYSHDGDESQKERQALFARKFADAGADVVLFSHNHLYEDFEVLHNSPRKTFVAWGLGNFIFGGNLAWRTHNDVRLLKIEIDKITGDKRGCWIYGYTSDWKFYLK